MALIRKKLVYDVTFTGVGTQLFFRCTNGPGAFAGALTRDRYGAVLQDFAALTRGSPLDAFRRTAVTAVYQPAAISGTTLKNPLVRLRFVNSLNAFTPSTPQAIVNGNTVQSGNDPSFSRHFWIRLDISGVTGVFTARGLLSVQRQHSIEV